MADEAIRGWFRYNKETRKVESFEKTKKIAEVNAPAVHGDEALDGIHSMADDKTYYSKSGYRNSLQKLGFEVTGGDHLQDQARNMTYDEKRHDREIREAAEKAYYDLKYDRIAVDEKSKQLNIEEERQWKAYQERQKAKWA